jgi:hypothetical protein
MHLPVSKEDFWNSGLAFQGVTAIAHRSRWCCANCEVGVSAESRTSDSARGATYGHHVVFFSTYLGRLL